MAIGRLQAALAAATNEVTIAAANLNFDFTLVKYEAPQEYQALGKVLSAKRKDNAELGSSHVVARQLGALFEDVCPATPRLLEAYGKRASEIAEASKGTSDPFVNTLFGDFTGIDGTSIWAAATSSKSSLHVHLLACLLARMWKAPEAIAIWVELVSERKKDIAHKVEIGEPVKFSLAAAAAGKDITRSQLASWDTSARAWLRTADDVFKLNQKQLELILKNINYPVHGDTSVFPSVIKSWILAVETMDKLVSGMPQAAHNGASLLGLAAWHLYPDITVFSPEMVEVKMNDALIADGGVLSLGLSAGPRNQGENRGVYWSLSLAQLRYYGKPVKVDRCFNSDSRITFTQLSLVIFGALLSEWRLTDCDADIAASTIISLARQVTFTRQGSTLDRRLLKLLSDGALAYLERANIDPDLSHKMIHLGRRRAKILMGRNNGLDEPSRNGFFFNIMHPINFIGLFEDQESQIKYLRHVASRLAAEGCKSDAFIIRCSPRMPAPPSLGPLKSEVSSGFPYHTIENTSYREVSLRHGTLTSSESGLFAERVTHEKPNLISKSAGNPLLSSYVERPTCRVPELFSRPNIRTNQTTQNDIPNDAPEFLSRSALGHSNIFNECSDVKSFHFIEEDPEEYLNMCGQLEDGGSTDSDEMMEGDDVTGCDESMDCSESMTEHAFIKDSQRQSKEGTTTHNDRENFNRPINRPTAAEGILYATALPIKHDQSQFVSHRRWLSKESDRASQYTQDIVTSNADEVFRSWPDSIDMIPGDNSEPYQYQCLLGDSAKAALFVLRSEYDRLSEACINIADLLWCLEHNLLDPAAIMKILNYSGLSENSHVGVIMTTLQLLACVALVYDDLPDTNINIGILDRSLRDTKWGQSLIVRHYDNIKYHRMSLSSAFSIIAYFESGVYDVDPGQLDNVIALSSENSLFVGRPLIQDPYESVTQETVVQRILGNVGNPGITFLLPPQDPMIREINPRSWRVASYKPFDGKASRSFEAASIHLSFTEYHVPLYDGTRGAHDNQISFMESVISVRDKGQWVADIDPYPLLNRNVSLRPFTARIDCQHQKDANSNSNIISVDSWNELLDHPDGIFVVRAGDNWIARLATTLVVYQRMKQTSENFAVTVCPAEVCWTCAQQSFAHHAFIY